MSGLLNLQKHKTPVIRPRPIDIRKEYKGLTPGEKRYTNDIKGALIQPRKLKSRTISE